jgi:hypothetical protein
VALAGGEDVADGLRFGRSQARFPERVRQRLRVVTSKVQACRIGLIGWQADFGRVFEIERASDVGHVAARVTSGDEKIEAVTRPHCTQIKIHPLHRKVNLFGLEAPQ